MQRAEAQPHALEAVEKQHVVADSPSHSIARHLLIWSSCAFVAILFASFHWGDPFTEDETWEFFAAKKLVLEGNAATVTGGIHMHHPHTFYLILGSWMRCFGFNEFGARSLGIFSTLLTSLLLMWSLRTCLKPQQHFIALATSCLYLLSPMAIQGSMIITADTALHHLVIFGFIAYAVNATPYTTKNWILLGLILCFALSIKIVTPVLLGAAFVGGFVLCRDWKSALKSLACCLSAALLFYSIWSLYCHSLGLEAGEIFSYLGQMANSRAEGSSHSAKIVRAGRSAMTVYLWFGLPFCALIALSIIINIKKSFQPVKMASFVFLLATGLLLTHTLVSGVAFGFPRYHYSLLPIWCFIIAQSISSLEPPALYNSKPSFLALLGFSVGLVFLLVLLGDPLLALNFDLKLAVSNLAIIDRPSLGGIALSISLTAISIPAAILYVTKRKKLQSKNFDFTSLCAASCVLALICNLIALNLIQASAKYQTALAYGDHGSQEVISEIKSNIEEGQTILAGKDIVYHTVDHNYIMDWKWAEEDFLLSRIRDRQTAYIVMSVQHNTIAQLDRMFTNAKFIRLLQEKYQFKQLGSFFLWKRINKD